MYRNNADDMSIAEQIKELRTEVSKNQNAMTGDQQYTARMTRNIILGVLGFTLFCGGMSYGCNHEDNKTKYEIAKQCPAVSPILAVGLHKAEGK